MIAPEHIKFIDIGGLRTRYYDDGGSGDPVVFIHGAHFGFVIPIGIEQWDLNLDQLAGSGRIIAFDKLGQGHTDGPARDDQWTFETLAAHAIGLLDALGLRNVRLVGHSRGGLLALHIAIVRPDLVSRLVVVSSASAAPDTAASVVNHAAAIGIGQLTPDQVVGLLATAQATDRPVPESFAQFARDVMALPNYAAQGEGLARNEARYWNPSLEAARTQILEHLRSTGLAIPTMVIWGMNDRTAPVALAYAFFEILAGMTSDATLTVLNQSGHNIFIDQPDAFNAAIRGFLSAQAG